MDMRLARLMRRYEEDLIDLAVAPDGEDEPQRRALIGAARELATMLPERSDMQAYFSAVAESNQDVLDCDGCECCVETCPYQEMHHPNTPGGAEDGAAVPR